MTGNQTFVYLLSAWLYATYIANRMLFIPLCFRKGRFALYALAGLAAGIAVTYMLTQYQMDIPIHRSRNISRSIPRIGIQQQAVWFLYIIVMAFSAAVGLLGELYRKETARQEAEMEKQKAELALYKAQINPHFLFNTLNTLYGMIVTGSDKAEKAFTEFTSLMKYMYSSSSRDTVSLETEVQYIKDYISLQKYRLPEHTKVEFRWSGDPTGKESIAPMIMVTFVENAFKYGVSPVTPGNISVDIKAENGLLVFLCENTVLNLPQSEGSKGIGIENCRKRLELLYHGRYSLEIGRENNIFRVELTVRLK